ncbi:MAG: tail fiber domain-containing protein [Chthoniobacterales bacterium]|nr:tail fiber domain-containing protein [Chthoniobacterales bacterium]
MAERLFLLSVLFGGTFSGVTVTAGVNVIIDGNGHLGTVTSSARYKEAIQPMDKASEAILALQPVACHYKKDLDPQGIPQFGLVAEEVAKVNPDLLARDDQGKPYTVRYEVVNAMLLNEFLKGHRKVEEEAKSIDQLKAVLVAQRKDFQAALAEQKKDQQEQIAKLSATMQEQAAQLRQVDAKLAAVRPTLRVVADNQ